MKPFTKNVKTPVQTMLSLAIAAVPMQSFAANESFALEEVVVTARKRSETLQDVPFSIAAMTENQLRNSGATNLEGMANNVAGLSVQNLGPGQSQVAIRGVSAGQIVRDQPGVKEQVGVYLDESVISLSLFTPDLDFYDMNRVEVLRGPQGTLFGSGSLAGTLRYISNAPSTEAMEGSISGDLHAIQDGSVGGDIKGHINVPMGDSAAMRVVAYHTEYAGFIDAYNPKTGKWNDDVNDGSRDGLRLTFQFTPSDVLTITPRIVYQDIEVNGANREDKFNILANEYTTTRPAVKLGEREQAVQLEELFTDEFLLADLTINADIGEMTLTSVTSYTKREILVRRDATALTASITGQQKKLDDSGALVDHSYRLPESVYLLDAPLDDTTDVKMLTQELRLASNNDSAFQWVGGIYYSKVERDYGQSLIVDDFESASLAVGRNFSTASKYAKTNELYFSKIPYELDQIALFGEGSYDVTDRLNLTLGLRWYDFDESRNLIFDGDFVGSTVEVPGKVGADGLSPRFIARYEASEDMTLNAQVSQGFRLGGINDPINKPLCRGDDARRFGDFNNFNDETMTNFEMGAKINAHEGRGQLNVAAFYSKIEDLQATLNAGSCSSRIIYNVPKAVSTGVEFEYTVRATENLDLGFSGTFTDSEIKSTVKDVDGNILGGIKDGNALPTAPEIQFSARATYMFPVGSWDAYTTGALQYVTERWTQIADQVNGGESSFRTVFSPLGNPSIPSYDYETGLDSYHNLNFRIGARSDNLDVAFYVNNVTDENAQLSLDRERGGSARVGYTINQPRTFGVTARYEF